MFIFCRLLVELVEKFGERKWSSIAQLLPGRIGKQCRERWLNHLKPNIKVFFLCFYICIIFFLLCFFIPFCLVFYFYYLLHTRILRDEERQNCFTKSVPEACFKKILKSELKLTFKDISTISKAHFCGLPFYFLYTYDIYI